MAVVKTVATSCTDFALDMAFALDSKGHGTGSFGHQDAHSGEGNEGKDRKGRGAGNAGGWTTTTSLAGTATTMIARAAEEQGSAGQSAVAVGRCRKTPCSSGTSTRRSCGSRSPRCSDSDNPHTRRCVQGMLAHAATGTAPPRARARRWPACIPPSPTSRPCASLPAGT